MTDTGMKTSSDHGAMMSRSKSELEMLSGAFVDLLDPKPETIVLDDIACGLSKQCRYAGQVPVHYSIAQHSVLVRDLLRSEGASLKIQRAGLLHDAPEAILHDVTSPLKWSMRKVEMAHGGIEPVRWRSAYDVLEERMNVAIAAAFDCPELTDQRSMEIVLRADLWALRIEAHVLKVSQGKLWKFPDDVPTASDIPDSVSWIPGMSIDDARDLWLLAISA